MALTSAAHGSRIAHGRAAKRVVGDAGSGVADDLGVPRLEPEHGKGVDAGVDAGQHREAFGGGAAEAGVVEGGAVVLVGLEEVVEHATILARPGSGICPWRAGYPHRRRRSCIVHVTLRPP